jgi:hypothetical protein
MPLSPNQLADFYQAIGGAIWHLQFLEDVVVTYLTMRLRLQTPFSHSLDEALRTLETERKKTLGMLVKEAKAAGIVQGELATACEALLNERNWLVHRVVVEAADGIYSEPHREALVGRIRKLTDDAVRLKKTLYAEVRAWCHAQGVDVARAESLGFADFQEIRRQ